jgi:hypothetical protein
MVLQQEFSDIGNVADAVMIVVRLSVAVVLGGIIGFLIVLHRLKARSGVELDS